MPHQNPPEHPEHGFGLMRGDLGLPPYAAEMLRVLYQMYLLRVHTKMSAWQEEGRPVSDSDLPDFDAMTDKDVDDDITHRFFAAAVDNGGLMLFVQRRADAAFQPGRWEIPTSWQRRGDRPFQALDRALQRATNLAVSEITGYLGYFDFVAADGARSRQHVFAVAVVDIAALHLGGDYSDHRWELANGTTEVVEDSVQNVLNNSEIGPSPRRPEIE